MGTRARDGMARWRGRDHAVGPADAPGGRGRRGRRHRRAGRGRSPRPSLGYRAGLMGPAAHHGHRDARCHRRRPWRRPRLPSTPSRAPSGRIAAAGGGGRGCRANRDVRAAGRIAAAGGGCSAGRHVRARRRWPGRYGPTGGPATGTVGCQRTPGRLDEGLAGAGRRARRGGRCGSPPARGDAARSGGTGRPASHWLARHRRSAGAGGPAAVSGAGDRPRSGETGRAHGGGGPGDPWQPRGLLDARGLAHLAQRRRAPHRPGRALDPCDVGCRGVTACGASAISRRTRPARARRSVCSRRSAAFRRRPVCGRTGSSAP